MSSIQFNLLPDVKVEYEQAKSNQKKVSVIAFGISAVCVGLFILSFLSVNGLQHKLLSDADSKMTNLNSQIKAVPNVQNIITVQNQLTALPSLAAKKHVMSRLFDYLPQVVPPKAGISDLVADTTLNTITITGVADSVQTVNAFVDTLKNAQYTTATTKTPLPAFSNIVLTSINRDSSGAAYTLTATYDPALFAANQTITLSVPQLTTPNLSQLFTGSAQTKQTGQ